MMKCGRGIVVISLATLLLSACSTSPQRTEPYSLPQYAEADSQCRDVTGSYNAVPHSLGKTEKAARPLLALTLLPAQDSLDSTNRITLKREDDGSLEVMAQGSDGRVLAKRRYAADSGVFECEDGNLEFYPRKLGRDSSAGIDWETVVLRKTEDGSLLLRKGGLFSGLVFMVIPMYVSTKDWYLFKPSP